VVNPRLHRFVDRKRLRAAIARAEEITGAPISVSIAPHLEGDVHAAAVRALHLHGLSREPGRNAVHFFVVPARREFAVVGDVAAHERLAQSAWDSVAATVEKHFRRGDPTAGLEAGIEEVAQHLAPHFPRKPPVSS
jgi:uncharacterized membrane protein